MYYLKFERTLKVTCSTAGTGIMNIYKISEIIPIFIYIRHNDSGLRFNDNSILFCLYIPDVICFTFVYHTNMI